MPCVTGARQETVLDVLSTKAQLEHAPYFLAHEDVTTQLDHLSLTEMRVNVSSVGFALKGVRSPFIGLHQIDNIATAVCAAEQLEHIFAQSIDNDTLTRGIENARIHSHLRCRFETIWQAPHTICDVAHNPPGYARLAETLDVIGTPPMIVVMGVMQDKDYRTMLRMIAPMCSMLVCVQPAIARALPSAELARESQALGNRRTTPARLPMASGLLPEWRRRKGK